MLGKKESLSQNQLGITFVELMLVIAIMAVISGGFYINTTTDKPDEVVELTETLINDFKRIRNLAVARTVYKFADNSEVYPVGGYGIAVNDTYVDGKARYWLYADKDGVPGYLAAGGDELIADEVIFSDADITLLFQLPVH